MQKRRNLWITQNLSIFFQRLLIARKEDLVDRELSLQEKDKLLAELRQNLARQPGVDVIDEAR